VDATKARRTRRTRGEAALRFFRLEETGFFVEGFVANFADGALAFALVDPDAADAFEGGCLA